MRVWRLVKSRYAAAAFDGAGARLYGARWSSPGWRVAYGASNSGLAVLEVLVHLGDPAVLPSYSLIEASLPDELIEDLDLSLLPSRWSTSPAPPEVQAIGDAWVQSGRSLALRVPSAVVPGSQNVLINPEHGGFQHLRVESLERFSFDPRLLR